ncbi:LLM class flavin-dependent oxidoreductase [Streptomyces sp. NBC_00370]|uniref:LLM class flavin-dependent oxidoreductase n=1 Tax=Streptomyces sp. NBC_00370 TaxID=2975728 RepID=UPI002E26D27D
MNYQHALRFGARLSAPDATGDTAAGGATGEANIAATARLAEELGYDQIGIRTPGDGPQQDVLTALSWTAAHTDKIGLRAEAPHVPALSAQEPAMLARAVASLDRLTGGRVELVLGAADEPDAMRPDEGPYGRRSDLAGVVGEALDVIRALWDVRDRGLAGTAGSVFRVSGAQKAAPAHEVPIALRGDRKEMLELAGRRFDGWVTTYDGAAALEEANRTIDDAARAAGRDPREIRREITISGRFGHRGAPFTGTPGEWVADLLPLVVDHGVGTIMIDTDDPDTLTRFAREVVPALRAAVDAALPHGSAGVRIRSAAVRARRRTGVDYDNVPAGLAEVVEPGDLTYGRFRSGYLRGGAPGVVLRAAGVEQVVAALAFARLHPELPLSRRSAGHGISGRSTNDGGIVIDVSAMNTIEVVDETARRVRIGPGARWMDVAAALNPYGWALSSGDYGGVGVGGLATAAGIGYLVRAHGLTIDHLREVEMVLADGSVVRASATENTDLFWAVRGAGANFGIVTSFEFEADEVGPVGYAELTQDAGDRARYLVDWGQFVESSPRDVTSFLIMPPTRGGQPPIALSRTVVDSDDPETVLARLQPLAGLGQLYAQQAQILPYAAIMANASDDEPQSQGEPVSRSGLLRHITPEFAAAAARVIASGSAHWFQIRALGGAVGDVAPDATAFAHRDANFSVVLMGGHDAVVDALWAELEPFFEGSYLSFDSSLRPERIEQAWPPKTLARLRALKAVYDPDSVFDDNFAITPAPSPATTPAAPSGGTR